MDAPSPVAPAEVLEIAPGELLATVAALKQDRAFDLLLDVTAVDWPGQVPRFEVVYHFYSTRTFQRVRVKLRVPEDDPTVDTLFPFYGAALFLERECHDMYGVNFRGIPDTRPILLYVYKAGLLEAVTE